MEEVRVYDSSGKLKKVISKGDLIKRSEIMLNSGPSKKLRGRGRSAEPEQKQK